MSDNKDRTEFEEKVWMVVVGSITDVFISRNKKKFIADLRQIMPPTCTETERKFLDRLRQEFYYSKVENGITKRDDEYDILYQDTFPDIDLKELVNE